MISAEKIAPPKIDDHRNATGRMELVSCDDRARCDTEPVRVERQCDAKRAAKCDVCTADDHQRSRLSGCVPSRLDKSGSTLGRHSVDD
ncbi:unnamed protein product [Soboliphyme baturini]|uniref:Lipoprotein n=1 Tax=Soboliphyme baturini TaxID=241478 RepID=A0A183IWD8_9BILA|nr:unnamed protein product [Soboliphyme baturini]